MRWMWMVMVGACGGDGPVDQATVDDLCDQTCGRFEECDLFNQFFTAEQCAVQCATQVDPSEAPDSDCEVSESEARACTDAWTALTCEELRSGTLPPECDLCEGLTTTTTTPPTDDATCDDLQGCCDQIADPDAQKSCDETVATGNDLICSTALQGFQLAGLCPQ